ncbi:MAG: phosphate ABC transporter permease subunit PstC [Sphingomonadales bacterium]
MTTTAILALLLLLSAVGFVAGRRRALQSVDGRFSALHSKPVYHGWYTALAAFVPGAILVLAWLIFGPALLDQLVLSELPPDARPQTDLEERVILNAMHEGGAQLAFINDPAIAEAAKDYAHYQNLGSLAVLALGSLFAVLGIMNGLRAAQPQFRARNAVERFLSLLLIASSVVAVLTTVGIILSLLFESLRFFNRVSMLEFLFGMQWSPQTAIRADQVGSTGAFGAVPLFVGTFLISFIAMCVAVPIGLMSAVYMTQYSSARFRQIAKPLLEILAGVPTVVYGFFAALTVAPLVRDAGVTLGLSVASESALAAGLVMGIMIIPFMSSLSDDAITAVPQAMRDGSFALGATKSETIRLVLIPAALPGIVGAFLLSVSRAIGETMIVVMAAGLAANLSVNPLDAVTTITVQIVTLLTGDQEFDSAKTLAAFALGLVLFVMTLCLNIIALRVVRKYRETYE